MTREKYGSRRIALFKGMYIENFLLIEHTIEQIIIEFFCERKLRPSLAPEEFSKSQEIAFGQMKKNKDIANFFEHFLFIEQGFTFNSKVQALKVAMQMLDAQHYNDLIYNNKYNIFNLIQQLNDLRNLIAHNTTGYKKSILIGQKKSKSFKGKQRVEIDKLNGKKIVITDYSFVPEVDTFKISRKIEDEIFEQLAFVNTYLSLYLIYDRKLNNEMVRDERYEKYKKYSAKILKYDVLGGGAGVFKLFNKDTKKEG